MPFEYTMLMLCREFHCTPSQLRSESAVDMLQALKMMEAEAEVRERNSGKR